MHVFTSITTNYIPKARVLATSLKRLHPQAIFHLVCADSLTGIPDDDLTVFDTVRTLEELPIPNVRSWAFKHSVVEMCTGVKGEAAREILRATGADRVYYFDPDIAVLGSLDDLEGVLGAHSIVLTPHQTVPEETTQAIVDNEICSLQHGVYNLGFLGVRATGEGWRFLDWWAERLLHWCYDDKPGGLFTDQRWVDLAPAFFADLAVLRDPQYNVATWNLTHRRARGTAPYGITIEDRPLCFFHFSGMDKGAQEVMLKRYGVHSPVLFDLRAWYVEECQRLGQSLYEGRPCLYNFYDNGQPIPAAHRLLYRVRADLQSAFPEPYATRNPHTSFYHWYQSNVEAPAAAAAIAEQTKEQRLEVAQRELAAARAELQELRLLGALRQEITALRAELAHRRAGAPPEGCPSGVSSALT